MARLKDLEVFEISLVDMPANQEKLLALKSKNKEEQMGKELFKKNEEVVETVETIEKPKAEGVVETAETNEVAEEPKAESKEEVAKALGKLEAVQKELNAYKEKEKMAIFKAEAEKLSNVNVDGLDVVLKEANEKFSKESNEVLKGLLNKVNSLVAKSDVFKELGQNAGEKSVNTIEDVERIAKSRAEKEGISFYKAFEQEMKNHKDIYGRV